MLRIGLTGGIASGKSLVATELGRRGALIIDADVLAREVVEPGTPALSAIRRRFGPDVLTENGRLDRPALGRIVFADADARRDLEAIIHPAVRRRAAEIEAAADSEAVVVHVIPLLVETGQQDAFDLCVVVDVEPAIQRERLRDRDDFDDAAIDARLAAAATRDQRLAVADRVLDNSGSVTELRHQIDRLWADITTL